MGGFMYPALLYLTIFLARFNDLQELEEKEASLVSSLFTNAWVLHSNSPDETSLDDMPLLLILKCSELLYSWRENQGALGPKMVKKAVLEDFNWKHPEVEAYAKKTEFWTKMFSMNYEFYRTNNMIFEWMVEFQRSGGLEIDRDETGEIARYFGAAEIKPHLVNNKTLRILEMSFGEVLRWRISSGDSMQELSTFCKSMTEVSQLKKHHIQSILISLEDKFQGRVRQDKSSKNVKAKRKTAQITRLDVFAKVMGFLDTKTAFQLLMISKFSSEYCKEAFYKSVLANGSFSHETRIMIWEKFVRPGIKSRELREDLPIEKRLEELIEMDLVRSTEFFDKEYFEEVKLILMNVAHDYPEVSYYQGMNYLGIFLFYTFEKDKTRAYRFFCFMIEYIIQKWFGQSFEGTLKLLYAVDKLLETIYPSMWSRLNKNGVSAIHFSVPTLITLFTCLIKTKDSYSHIYEIWDCIISHGVSALLKSLLLLLEIQQSHLFKIPSDSILLVMKNVEKDPFAIVKHFKSEIQPNTSQEETSSGIIRPRASSTLSSGSSLSHRPTYSSSEDSPNSVSAYSSLLTKPSILQMAISEEDILNIEYMFDNIRSVVVIDWDGR